MRRLYLSLLFQVLTVLLIGLSCLGIAFAQQASSPPTQSLNWWNRSIWDNPDRGALWYAPERPAPPPDVPTPPPEERTEASKPPEVMQMEAIKAKLEELRTVAIINPSKENIRAYIAFQEEQMQRSSVFADSWRRVLWENPELDYSMKSRPTNATALNTWDKQYGQTVKASLSDLAQTHGIYFFFRSDCTYCHVMAPTLKLLEQKYGIKVIAISLDGKGISEFPNFIVDHGQAEQLGVKATPSFFLAQPGSKTVFNLGSGVIALNDLEDRIYTLAYTQAGQKF